METIQREAGYSASLSLGSDPDDNEVSVSLIHEWGDTVVDEADATRDGVGEYSYEFSSIDTESSGVHKILWGYEVSEVATTSIEYIDIYQPYTVAADFFEEFPHLENEYNTKFDALEIKGRAIVNTYCGQNFDYYPAKTLTVDGNNHNKLTLPASLRDLTSVTAVYTSGISDESGEITNYIEQVPNDDFFVRYKAQATKFDTEAKYEVVGNWGWKWVPINVKKATEIIMADLVNDDALLRRHGVTDVYMDTHRMRFDDSIFFSSTGNIDADVLLMDYQIMHMTYV